MRHAVPLRAASPPTRWLLVVAAAFALLVAQRLVVEHGRGALSGATHAATPTGDAKTLFALCALARVPYPPPDVRIVVEKSARRLTLYSGDRALARYRVALGFSPLGPKHHEGDGRTPEGALRVVTRNEKSRFRKFLGLGYPRPSDARDAALTPEEQRAIEVAFMRGTQPPWNTPLGGAVGIHGHGADRDWTSGCIAVDDAVIDVLWEAAPLGTIVDVRP